MYCEKCGAENLDGAVYCCGCGEKIGEASKQSNTAKVGAAIGTAADKLYEVTGGEGHAQLKFREFFSSVFKHHARGEAEEIFICGTATTTPDIKTVSAEWPRPWLWSRILVVLAVVIVLLGLLDLISTGSATGAFSNGFIGALVIPFAIMVFFFETNAPRNISLPETLAIFFIGGVASLIVINLLPGNLLAAVTSGSDATGIEAVGVNLLAAFVMETAKVIVIVIALSLRGRHERNYILNGFLVGAAVGAGFLFFNSVADMFFQSVSGADTMFSATIALGLSAIGGPVAWGAVEGAVLALVNKKDEIQVGQVANPMSLAAFMLTRPAFLVIFVLCIAFNTAWNTILPDATLDLVKLLVLVVAIWVVIMVMLNRGLDEINELNAKAEADAVENTPSPFGTGSSPQTKMTEKETVPAD